MSFKIGDRVKIVRYINSNGDEIFGHRSIGKELVIKEINMSSRFPYHCNNGTGYKGIELELISTKKKSSIMNKITAKIKRIFKENQRLQYRAGLIDECGNLTGKGKDEREELLNADYDKKLTERAREIIKEEKENK